MQIIGARAISLLYLSSSGKVPARVVPVAARRVNYFCCLFCASEIARGAYANISLRQPKVILVDI
jgi:hypothetical protein